MTLSDWINVILLVSITLALGITFIKVSAKHKHIFITPAYKKTHKRTEARLLNYILEDMRTNPHEWLATPYDMSTMRAPHFVNDKKNIAVVVSQNSSDSVIVKMNLTEAHKYNEHAEDTVATAISGDHVTKFLRKVEECIDTRGKELSFIEHTLKNRL